MDFERFFDTMDFDIVDGNKINLSDFENMTNSQKEFISPYLMAPVPSDIPVKYGKFGAYQSESEPFAMISDEMITEYDNWLWGDHG
ncbi:MAG: hypothetical protein EOM23_09505 [Candidatus Moranbacteria bacterium]|nr:hypothetical protein [Candidatus Moranbacteria bacterium]